jgi:DNA-binding transcriptional ArsR family regulator
MKQVEVDSALAALAEPTRRAVVELLRQRPHRAGELAKALAMSPAALSRHLRVLRATGLVADEEPESDARVRLYRLQPEGFQALGRWVDEVRGLWADQLVAFKAHVEQRTRHDPGDRKPS